MMSNDNLMEYSLRPMRQEDIAQVVQIDRDAFPENVAAPSFKRELNDNKVAHYLVAWATETTYTEWAGQNGMPVPRREETPKKRGRVSTAVRRMLQMDRPRPAETEELLIGYLGMWVVVDEIHIVSVGVRSSYRRNGIGELLVLGALEMGMLLNCRQITLECRVSNEVAQNLYKKYGFRVVGRRKRYYSDNGEDAYVMTADAIDTPDYQSTLTNLRAAHSERWGVSVRYYDIDDDN